MYEYTKEDVISMITSKFDVIEHQSTLESLIFRISDIKYASKFVQLARELESKNMIASMWENDGIYIAVKRLPIRKNKRWLSSTWIPRGLFALVVSFVMIDGYYKTIGVNKAIYIGEPLEMAAIYTISLLGILGVHEAGHMFASKIHKLKTAWPYFIPGLPVIGFVPTFGAIIKAKGLTINKKILFDVAIAGPIAGLVIAVIVSLYGAYTAPVIADIIDQSSGQLVDWQNGEPLFMTGALALFGKGQDNQEVLMTPVLFAAWLGFLITFLNLLPASQLDGGHMIRTLVSEKWHKIATYASMGVLAVLGYWLMAILILVLSSRNSSAQILDDVSPLTRKRKFSYIGIIILAILCAPLPQWLSP